MVMDNSGYAVEIEDREYVNPDIGIAENDEFIEKLRGIQAQNNQEIARDTYNLGTPIPSNLGGLGGAEGGAQATWQARYQTPQINNIISNLDTTARQYAANTAMQNRVDIAKNRYQQAQRNYNKAQHRYSTRGRGGYGGYGGYGNGGNNTNNNNPTELSEGKTDLNFDGDEQITPIKASPELRESLNKWVTAGRTPSGFKLWEGYRPNLSQEENFFNYISNVARKKDSGK